MLPAVLYAEYYRRYAPSDEDLAEILEQKYSEQIATARASRPDFQVFMDQMKNNSTELDKTMDSVLKGGKDSAKRVYAVDDALYGKQDGRQLKKQTLVDINGTRQEKIRKARESREMAITDDNKTQTASRLSNPQTQSVIALVVAGGLAAAVGFLLGGSKRQ